MTYIRTTEVSSTHAENDADDASSPPSAQVHLLTLVHGMWGEPAHLSRLAEIVRGTHAKSSGDTDSGAIELVVLLAETNRDNHTYDGVDWGAERVVREVHDEIAKIEKGSKKVTRFSILGYSFGGLVARYAVGILYSQGFFDDVVPMNFATIATPNIGLLRYPTFWSAISQMLGPIFLSRTGEHFFATDVWEGLDASKRKPLLEVMSEKGGVFFDGLSKFSHVTVLGNAINDRTVPFITAMIEPYDPFVAYAKTGLEIDLDEEYPPIVKAYSLPLGPPPPEPPSPTLFSPQWWREWYNRPSSLPPFLVRPFPWNILVYILLPLAIPLLFLTVVAVFGYRSFHSRRRIRLLESEGTGNRNAIMQLMQTLERGVEDAVVELMEDDVQEVGEETILEEPAGGSRSRTPTEGSRTPLLVLEDEAGASSRKVLAKPRASAVGDGGSKLRHRRRSSINYVPSSDANSPYYAGRAVKPSSSIQQNHTPPANGFADTNPKKELQNQPILTPTQLRMIENLNALPNLRKEIVFLDNLRNSHATIVCRDLRFEFHRRGEGVLRKFADEFEL